MFVSADYYLSRNGLPTSLEPMQFDQPVKEHRCGGGGGVCVGVCGGVGG